MPQIALLLQRVPLARRLLNKPVLPHLLLHWLLTQLPVLLKVLLLRAPLLLPQQQSVLQLVKLLKKGVLLQALLPVRLLALPLRPVPQLPVLLPVVQLV